MIRPGRSEFACCYGWPSVSIIALVAWFSPWLFDPRKSLVLYLLAFGWFLVAWLAVGGQLVAALLLRKKGLPIWRHHVVAVSIHLACYAGLLWGLASGYMVTV